MLSSKINFTNLNLIFNLQLKLESVLSQKTFIFMSIIKYNIFFDLLQSSN